MLPLVGCKQHPPAARPAVGKEIVDEGEELLGLDGAVYLAEAPDQGRD
jgi:hypothetical protein